MTQQPLLDYQTPQFDRMGDADPRWLRKLFAGVVLMAGGSACGILIRYLPGATQMAAIQSVPAAMALLAAWLLTARPPRPLGMAGVRSAVRILATVAFPLRLGLAFIIAVIFKSASRSSWMTAYSYVVLLYLLMNAVDVALWYYYLSRLLRLIPAPALAVQVLALGLAVAFTSLAYILFLFVGRFVFPGAMAQSNVFFLIYGWMTILLSLGCVVVLGVAAVRLWRLGERGSY